MIIVVVAYVRALIVSSGVTFQDIPVRERHFSRLLIVAGKLLSQFRMYRVWNNAELMVFIFCTTSRTIFPAFFILQPSFTTYLTRYQVFDNTLLLVN